MCKGCGEDYLNGKNRIDKSSYKHLLTQSQYEAKFSRKSEIEAKIAELEARIVELKNEL